MGHGLQPPNHQNNLVIKYAGYLCFVLFAAFVFWNYYTNYPLTGPYFSENLKIILKALFALFVFTVSSLVLGKLIWKTFGGLSDPAGENYITFALGATTISGFVLGISLVGLFYSYLFWIFALISIISFSFSLKGKIISISKIQKALKESPASTIYIFVMILIALCLALSPTVESDALRYHVALPDHMIQTHGFFYYPYNAFYQFPAVIEMQFAFTQFIGDTISPKLVHWFYLVLTTGLLFNFSKRFFPSIDPIIPIVIFVSTPFIPIISGWAFVETAQTFYVLVVLYLIFLLREGTCIKQISISLGILLGALLGIKYPMMAIIPVFVLLTGMILWEKNKKILVQGLCILLIPLLFMSLPWYFKNYVYTGNPVYPFAYFHFGGDDWNEHNTLAYMKLAQGKGGLYFAKKQSFLYQGLELFLLPIKATMSPQSFALYSSPENSWLFKTTQNYLFIPQNFGDWQLGPIYLVFFPLILVFLWSLYKKKKTPLVFSVFCLLLFIFWNYLVWAETYRDNRFLLPILPLVAILVVCGFQEYKNMITKTVLWILLIYNLFWVVQTVTWFHNPLPFMVGGVSKDQYLNQKLDYYRSFQWVDKNNVERKPVLLIGEYHSLYLQSPNYTSDYYDTPVILRAIQGANQISEIYARLAEMHVGYILYNENEMSKYLYDFSGHFQSSEEVELFRQFITDLAPKTVKRFDMDRDISQNEVLQIRQFMNDSQRDPRAIYIFKI